MDVSHLWLPKIAPTIIERPRIVGWLERCASSPLRLLAAPAGSGKTTSVVVYARSRVNRCVYVRLTHGMSLGSVLSQISLAVGRPPVDNYKALLEQFHTLDKSEIILDNVDDATVEVRELLGRLYGDVGDNVNFVYVARSAKVINIDTAQAQGMAEVCDDTLFAFDRGEIGTYARSLGLRVESEDARRLHDATHGWAIAVTGTCRTAMAQQLPLAEALMSWRQTNEEALRQFVIETLRLVPQSIRTTFSQSIATTMSDDPHALEMYRRHGLFVTLRDGHYAINPLLRSANAFQNSADEQVLPATVEMFGRFSMSIEGRVIEWQRRRDGQVIQYLAMRPDGRATRAELIAAFWPNSDPHLAAQSLRTACCTIRRAIGNRVGAENVARYFVADRVVELKLTHALISARRFTDLYERAEAADARNDLAGSSESYRAAKALYKAPFLIGEPAMGWAVAHEARLAKMYEILCNRLNQMSRHRPVGQRTAHFRPALMSELLA